VIAESVGILRRASLPLLVTVGALALWQIASGTVVNAYYVSKPSEIATRIVDWFASGYILPHLASTFEVTVLGFAIAAVAGIASALVLAVNPIIDEILSPFLYASFSLPKIALAPVLIFWVGVGMMPPLLLASITAFYLVFFNAYTGIRGVSDALIRSVRLMGSGPLDLALKVRLPAAAPHITQGLSQGLIYAFHGAIVGEMTASNRGVGYVLVYAATDMDSTGVLTGLVLMGVISYALVAGLERLSKRVPGGATQ
jgi:NitT/TauT family transport system permease protein